MTNQTAKELLGQYLELKSKTVFMTHLRQLNQKVFYGTVSTVDVEAFLHVTEEIIPSLKYLSDNELIELACDDDPCLHAEKILYQRRGMSLN